MEGQLIEERLSRENILIKCFLVTQYCRYNWFR
jgi:hypothetical protein